MKNKYLIVITCLSFCLISCKSVSSKKEETVGSVQKCTLIFRAPQEEMTVRVYKPIDNTFNYSYIADKLDIKPNISIHYELDVNGFGFVQCRFSNGSRRLLLVTPGDCIEISCEPQKIAISGSNAEGHNYYNNNYVDRGTGYYSEIIERHMTKAPINYDSIYYYFQQELILPYQTDLKKMEISGSITTRFSSILAKDLYFACCFALETPYIQMLIYNKVKEFKPSEEDVWNILRLLDRLYDMPYAMSDDAKKMPYYSMLYYRLKYKYLDNETKEKLAGGYDEDCFGGYPYFLLASDSVQLREFGTLLISDLQNGTANFNHEKLLAYLGNKFPDSEYVAIIKKLMAQSREVDDEIVIIDDSPSSIKGLMQIPGIKGKYAYIDLWATWCMPCTVEFQYNDDIHKLFAQYNNIVPVYISFDNDRKLWESRVAKFNLKGYNIMASKLLNEDIGMKVYRAKQVGSIPRYLLLDPDGNIVNDNLPRPSKNTLLKPILANALK